MPVCVRVSPDGAGIGSKEKLDRDPSISDGCPSLTRGMRKDLVRAALDESTTNCRRAGNYRAGIAVCYAEYGHWADRNNGYSGLVGSVSRKPHVVAVQLTLFVVPAIQLRCVRGVRRFCSDMKGISGGKTWIPRVQAKRRPRERYVRPPAHISGILKLIRYTSRAVGISRIQHWRASWSSIAASPDIQLGVRQTSAGSTIRQGNHPTSLELCNGNIIHAPPTSRGAGALPATRDSIPLADGFTGMAVSLAYYPAEPACSAGQSCAVAFLEHLDAGSVRGRKD